MANPRARKVALGCGAFLLAGSALLLLSPVGHDLQTGWRRGFIQAALFPPEKRTYTATNDANLKALHTALLLYHESEGQFPDASGWMDAIQPRIAASDLAAGEAAKKLVRPDLAESGGFGYAMNQAASGKYRDDVGAPDTVLIFESKQTGRNASGDPTTDRVGMAISIDGTLSKPQ